MAARRQHGSGSIRQLGPGHWKVVASLPIDPATGERRQRTKNVRGTKADAQRELTALLASVAKGPVASDVTVALLIERFMVARSAGPKAIRRNTRKAWEIAIRDVVVPAFGAVPVSKLSSQLVADTWLALEERGESLHKLKRSYVVLKRAFDYAKTIGWVGDNPVKGVSPTPPPRPAKGHAIEPEVARALLAAVRHDVELHAWLRLASATGARRGEVIGLRWSDIDVDERTVTIDEGVTIGDNGAVEVGPTKTKDHRLVQVDAETIAAVLELRAHRERGARLAGIELEPGAFLFCRDVAGAVPWRPDTTSDRYAAVRARVPGAEETTLHTLRHNTASYLLASGVDVETVAQRLGHRSTKMTLDVYGAALKSKAKEAGQMMGDLLG